jgi:hypothetical protein
MAALSFSGALGGLMHINCGLKHPLGVTLQSIVQFSTPLHARTLPWKAFTVCPAH